MKMVRLLTDPNMISLLTMVSMALGCGVMPPGQGSSLSAASLCLLPCFTSKTLQSQSVPDIATNAGGAEGLISRLIMQTVFDVLECQARSVLLPDAVISSILDQLNATNNYERLNCQKAVLSLMGSVTQKDEPTCIISGNMVTGICSVMNDNNMCNDVTATLASISASYTAISETFMV
ncbi:hypothetical protein KIN20_026815 [Parelaphostrongylus tenuis]|uniref:Secreted protein n=1 Tax=Parelaphostrongylus tenuis TaxID=148309 RepID=A0AAD5WD66_PARTN|nr:hypothetical protein KIN20_026815 [Parelaphostrongylus tenuis]